MNNSIERKKNENGAIVIEATISLSVFVFVIFTILSVVNICYIQARINFALNSAAKEISQYTYLYYALGADEVQAGWYEDTSEERDLAKDTISGVSGLLDTISGIENNAASGDFDALVTQLETIGKGEDESVNAVKDLVKEYSDKIKEDPKQFLFGMAKLAGTEIAEVAKVYLAEIIAEAFMSKNLTGNTEDTMDAYLKRHDVVDGKDGLDFTGSSMMAYGVSDKIQLMVTYDVEVIKLLNIDFKFTLSQCSQTTSWGNGVSMLQDSNVEVEIPKDPSKPDHLQPTEPSLWEMDNAMERGKLIVSYEKKAFVYTKEGRGHGFDAYEPDTNTFVSVISINTYEKTYQDSSKVKSKITKGYKDLKNGVKDLGEDILVNERTADQTQNIVTKNSPPSSRKYKVIVIVPEGYDQATRDSIKSSIESTYSDVTVVIKGKYGKPNVTETPTE